MIECKTEAHQTCCGNWLLGETKLKLVDRNSYSKILKPKWMFPKIVVLIRFSIINHQFWDTTIFGNTQIIAEMFCKNIGKLTATLPGEIVELLKAIFFPSLHAQPSLLDQFCMSYITKMKCYNIA